MKIAITSTGAEASSLMDGRFGRAPYFMVFDSEQNSWLAFENRQNAELSHGAGIQAAQALEGLGANVLITGNVGPKALQVLRANGTRIFCGETRTVADALSEYLAGRYAEYFAPNEGKGV